MIHNRLCLVLLSLVSAQSAIAANVKDANWITPADLPREVTRRFSAFGRTPMPQISQEYAIQKALADTTPERICMAKVGQQLSDWQRKDEVFATIYWRINLTAQFACLPPLTSANFDLTEENKALFEARRALPRYANSVEILCHERLDEVCHDAVLYGYNEHYTCELTDSADPTNHAVIEDIEDNDGGLGWSKKEGARNLWAALPVYTDGRRDDDIPAKNCAPHTWHQLKGLSRRTAVLTFAGDLVHVAGMIRQ